MLTIHKDSHTDHAITREQMDFLISTFAERDGFFIETVELPESLGTVPCGLYGPIMGDLPVVGYRWDPRPDCPFPAPIRMANRGERAWKSRVIGLPSRQVRTITVIAGPHDGQTCVLYTAFGGPCAPQEPGDPTCKDRAKSEEFWAQHALAY